MERPEYFVLRLYRLDGSDGTEIEGIAEVVANGKQFPFASAQELWAVLESSSNVTAAARSE